MISDKFHEIYTKPEWKNPLENTPEFPLIIDIELKRGKGEYMRPQIFFYAMKQAREYGARGIRFNRGGDPLSHRGVIRFIRSARKDYFLAGLKTRGRLLYLSVDSLCNVDLNTFTLDLGNLSFDNYHLRLKDLTIMKRRRRETPFIRVIGYTPNDYNISSESEELFKEACDEFELSEDKPEVKKCLDMHRCMTIGYNGDVLLCPTDYIHISKAGNIGDGDLYSIWNSDKTKELRKEPLNFCKDCHLWQLVS